MRLSTLAVLVLSTATLLTVACGGSDDSAAPSGSSGASGAAGGSAGTGGAAAGAGGGASDATACAALAKANCAKRETCRASEATRAFGSVTDCETRLAAACVVALGAPDTGGSKDQTTACAAATDAASCDAWLAELPVAGCGPAVGKRADGAACTYPGQCASSHCATPSGAACGTCAPMPKAGDTCGNGLGCGATALRCDNATDVCVVPVVVGGVCAKGQACAEGASCIGATKDTMGTCTADAKAVGAACAPKQDTAPDCDKTSGLYCDKTTSMCAKDLVALPGASCGNVGDALTLCSEKSACIVPTGQKSGTCVAFAADGASCDTAVGPLCLAPSRCVVTSGTAGTCKQPDPAACN